MNYPSQTKIILKIYSIDNYPLYQEKPVMYFHNHNTIEFSYVLSGELVSTIKKKDGKEDEAHIFPHHIMILRPFVYHKSSIPNSLHTITMELSLDSGNIYDYLYSSPYIRSFPEMDLFFQPGSERLILNDTGSVMMKMIDLQKYAVSNSDLSIRDHANYDLSLRAFFLELLSCAARKKENTKQNFYLKRVLSILDDNFDRDLSIDEIAQSVGISSSYMRNLFAKEIGMSPKKKQNEIRIQKSCLYLRETTYSIQEIAKAVGYNSVQSFNENFKIVMKMTPVEYRESLNREGTNLFYQSDKGVRDVDILFANHEKLSKNL